MNGAESLVRTLLNCGVTHCYANPGTSEMHLVQAIDAVDDFSSSLCLFEGVCTGAADGYGRMTGIPATTLLHLGAGLGNGIANLHNCRRAGTPLINLIGDHAIHHAPYDAPLTSDVEAVAKPVSSWIRTSRTSQGLGIDAEDSVLAALSNHPDPQGNIATLIIPTDCAWGEGIERKSGIEEPLLTSVDSTTITSVARRIDSNTVLLVDGNGLSRPGVKAAGRIAAKTGCRVFTPTFPARVDVGPDLPDVNRLPYFPEDVLHVLQGTSQVVLAGGAAPVSFFAYQGQPSNLVPPDTEVVHLAHRHEDVAQALLDVALEIEAPAALTTGRERPELPSGDLRVRSIAQAVAALAPENCVVSVDSGGGGAAYNELRNCVPHSWLNLTGGSIGGGGPVAVGAATACPDRTVFALLGDGGAGYTIQYLWTAAREDLKVISVIFSNRQYNILEVEYRRMGVNEIGAKAASLFDLTNPELDWVAIAKGFGVPGQKATDCASFNSALQSAIASEGPYLIEADLVP